MIEHQVITACAGSGKTHDLVMRLLEILRQGGKPVEILAITFTHKAAAEIRERLLQELQKHATAEPKLGEWRRRILLAQHPDDVFNVHTFHSWFMALMHHRPWREGRVLPPQLQNNSDELFERAWHQWQRQAENRPSPSLKKILKELSPLALQRMLKDFYKNRNAWRLYRQQFPDANVDDTLATLCKEYVQFVSNLQKQAAEYAQVMAAENKTVKKTIDTAKELSVHLSKHPAGNCDESKNKILALESALLTQSGTPRLVVQNAADKQGQSVVFDLLIKFLEEVLRLNEEQQAVVFNKNAAKVFDAFDVVVEDLKRADSEMTFDDLELQVWDMLGEDKIYSALSHRLYAKYRHVLIDEFQDTSPIQWQIIHRWLWDSHGNDEQPSVFIVGDTKQAIYGFRHGDAKLLGHAAAFLQTHYGAPPPQPKNVCRRCAGYILDVVNKTFSQCPEMEDFVEHQTLAESNSKQQGRVEWHFYSRPQKTAVTQNNAVRNPLVQSLPDGDDVQKVRSQAVANKVREIINTWRLRDDTSGWRKCCAEDILILLPAFTHAETQKDALSAVGVNCATGGRADSLEAFECGDMVDLITVLLSPTRGYPLARVLKSPLFALDDSQLAYITKQSGDTLWAQLQNTKFKDSKNSLKSNSPDSQYPIKRARILLAYWQRLAQRSILPAHDFLAKLYRQGNIIARYKAAVMPSLQQRVCDNLLWFLDFSVLASGGARPLLAQFLDDVRAERFEAMPTSAQGVRLMTIHGAKGLESPIVILADSAFEWGAHGSSVEVLSDWPPNSPHPANFMALPRALERAGKHLRSHANKKYKQEIANQLYVAMTRAQQALIIFAPETHKPPTTYAANAMHDLVGVDEGSGALCYGESFCMDENMMKEMAESTASQNVNLNNRTNQTKAIGERINESAAMVRGDNRHRIMALLLSGVPLSVAKGVLPAEPKQWHDAQKMYASEKLQALLSAADSILIEREFILDEKIVRPDLVIIGEELWIVDYKTGVLDVERFLPQLQKYAQAVSPHYVELQCRLAILDVHGKLHELSG